MINRFDRHGIINSGAEGVIIQGNFIGTDVTGAVDVGNGVDGIQILARPPFNLIGGTDAADRNLISGNERNGILLTGMGHTVQGNYIGTDVTGLLDRGNTEAGIMFQAGSTHCIGGTSPGCLPAEGAGNVISGNGTTGINTASPPANVTIIGNFIGTNPLGTALLGNGVNGIGLSGNDHIVGVAGEYGGNVITNNGQDGVLRSVGTGASIRFNSIYSNGANPANLGIDLITDGVTPNDEDDVDSIITTPISGNNLQNFPVLTSADAGAGLDVAGTLNSTPNTSFVIDIYSNLTCDTSGNGEGRTHRGSIDVMTNGDGDVAFNSTVGAVSAGLFITATATRSAAPLDTSEFSACRQVIGGAMPTPSPSPSPSPTGSPTPTPTLTSTGSASPSPSQSATPTPTPTPTVTPTGSATPTPTTSPSTPPGEEVIWGDHNCSDASDSVDSLLTLRHDASLGTDTEECPEMARPSTCRMRRSTRGAMLIVRAGSVPLTRSRSSVSTRGSRSPSRKAARISGMK